MTLTLMSYRWASFPRLIEQYCLLQFLGPRLKIVHPGGAEAGQSSPSMLSLKLPHATGHAIAQAAFQYGAARDEQL